MLSFTSGIHDDAEAAIMTSDNAYATAEKALQDTEDIRNALPGLEDKMSDVVAQTDAYNKAVDDAEEAGKEQILFL